MYIPRANKIEDTQELLAFMRAHSFATLISILDNSPHAVHIPILVKEEGDQIILEGHMARANPQWKVLEEGKSLVIFQGPHAYISPTLYEKFDAVPTWNYVAVHATGTAILIDPAQDPDRIDAHLREVLTTYEESYLTQFDQMSDKYREGQMQGIMAFTLVVSRLEGKYKLSQNRSEVDQRTVAGHLLNNTNSEAAEVGTMMLDILDNLNS